MPEELNHQAEEEISNPPEGDESSSSDDLSEVFTDEEESSSEESSSLEENTLEALNQKSGKNFKSLDDVAKSLKQADKLFAEQGQKAKGDAKPSTPTHQPSNDEVDVLEEVLLARHPEAEYVLKDAKHIARQTGKSVLKVFREETWLQDKARAEFQKVKDEQKVSSPSTNVSGQGYNVKKFGLLSAKDKALLRRHNLTEKDIKLAHE